MIPRSDPTGYTIRQDIFSIGDSGASIDTIRYTFSPTHYRRPSQFEVVLLPPDRPENSHDPRPIAVSVPT